jgi:hypothetical protein
MDRTFNFRQSQELLQVDPKTFGRWLEKAQIDPKKQVNRADPRQKWLTEEQLRMLAREHGRELPPLDQEDAPEPRPEVILTTVDERLFALEQQLTHRFDQLDARLEQLLAELQQARASAPPQERPPAPAPRARMASSASASTSSTPTPTAPPKPTAKKRGKRKTKARNLPRTLMPLSTFRQVHSVSEKAVENAVQRGKLAVVRGEWLYQHRYITTALDRQGQQQFYALFSEREGFQLCKDCPHAL